MSDASSNDELYSRAKQVVIDALEVPAERLEGFLAEACGPDQALRAEVESLLAHREATPSLLEQGVQLDDVGLPGAGFWVGHELGPWTLKERIGSGGMATVFLAERTRGEFDQSVAVKVMASQLLDSDAALRFRVERQILADLNHPYIAKLIDGGTTADNVPYLVMEYVRGQRLDTYCDEAQMGIPSRLRLFLKVCSSVSHAHRRLIVHRDIKPSNILVDTEGEPKLLDFGIAKLLDPGSTSKDAALTQTGFNVMTPEYASPEQVRGEAVSTSVDVYALGVVLYRLLTGRSPYRRSSSNLAALREAVLHDVPTRPSAVAAINPQGRSEAEPSCEDLAVVRSAINAAALSKSLRGDLDVIVASCLHKETDRRYPNVQALAEDITRHLDGRPILARTDDLPYRLAKFVRRNAREAILTGAALVILGTLSIYYTLNLARERDLARREAAKATQVANFVAGLFETADPLVSGNRDIRVREVVDRGAERMAQELANQDEVRASLLTVLGRVYASLGMYETAIEHYKGSLALLEGSSGREDLKTLADTHFSLGVALEAHKDIQEADHHYQRGYVLRSELFGPEDSSVAENAWRWGILLRTTGRFEEAAQRFEEARVIWTALDDPRRTYLLVSLGQLEADLDEFKSAESLFREALTVAKAEYGEPHHSISYVLGTLAQLLKRQSRFEEARAAYEDVLRNSEAVWGGPHPDIAEVLGEFGELCRQTGDYETSEALQERALTMRRELGEVGPFEMARSYIHLARLAQDQGRFKKAETLYRRSLRLHQEAVGPEHPKGPIHLDGMSWVLYDQKKYTEAESWARKALALSLKLHRTDSMQVAHSRMHLARALFRLGRLEAAKTEIRESGRIAREKGGESTTFAASSYRILAEIMLAGGELKQAEAECRKSLASLALIKGETVIRVASVQVLLARVKAAQGDFTEARRLLTQAIDDVTARHSKDHPRLQRWQGYLAEIPKGAER